MVLEALWMEIVKKYLNIRPTPDMSKLFISIRNGKATRQNIGHNTIGQMPKKIAMYLNLQNPGTYTGHSFRRTSATILASSGGNTLQLKQHGGWKSSTVAEGYVEDSLAVKKNIARMVQGSSSSTSTNFDAPFEEANTFNNTVINVPTTSLATTSNTVGPGGITMTCHNCTINYYFNK